MSRTLYDRYTPILAIILVVGGAMVFGWWVVQLVDQPAKPLDVVSHSR